MASALAIVTAVLLISITMATYQKMDESEMYTIYKRCPQGLQQLTCAEETIGCNNATCTTIANASCRTDACNHCSQHFVDSRTNIRLPSVECDCPQENRVKCFINPCDFNIFPRCRSHEPVVRLLSKCESFPCGGCGRRWFIDGPVGSIEVSSLCDP